MGREIRRVPKDWVHPKDSNGNLEPLHEPHADELLMIEEWIAEADAWARGEHEDQQPGECAAHMGPDMDGHCPYWEWAGGPPDPNDYMPFWTEAEATHYQMYETCTAGTPISPVFATPEEVARWCADNGGGDASVPR